MNTGLQYKEKTTKCSG